MLDSFATSRIERAGVALHTRSAGTGPALLLIHGHPQTHAMWHLVAPALTEKFTVVMIDRKSVV